MSDDMYYQELAMANTLERIADRLIIDAMTKTDKFPAMNEEELSKYLAQLADKQTCSIDWLAFLKKEESDV